MTEKDYASTCFNCGERVLFEPLFDEDAEIDDALTVLHDWWHTPNSYRRSDALALARLITAASHQPPGVLDFCAMRKHFWRRRRRTR